MSTRPTTNNRWIYLITWGISFEHSPGFNVGKLLGVYVSDKLSQVKGVRRLYECLKVL